MRLNFAAIFELAADCKFEKLRDFIAKKIGLEIIIESLGWIKSYDFLVSEGNFVDYLRTKGLCNDKYFTNFNVTSASTLSIQCLRSVL